MSKWTNAIAALALWAIVAPANAQAQGPFTPEVERAIQSVLPRMIAWRRDFHQHPELSYEEVRTARVVAAHLRSLRMEVRTGVAQTGVVGVLRGARPGPVIALRADMDALPVTEEGDLPFARARAARINGQSVGIMHACGHDTHVAVLMAAASVLAARREELAGTVIFVFQPSEEGAPPRRPRRRAAHAGGERVRRSRAGSDVRLARLAEPKPAR